ncbi:MAG: hypothetical protein ABSF25_11370 [Bryobacteraceae bacterium]|jgi:hypothetical protein
MTAVVAVMQKRTVSGEKLTGAFLRLLDDYSAYSASESQDMPD